MAVIEVDDEGFEKFVKDNTLVIFDLWAPWCGPCKIIEPVFEELAQEYGQRVGFAKLNIDSYKRAPAKHQVMNIPTLLIFKDGELVDRIVGAVSKDKIKSKLEQYL